MFEIINKQILDDGIKRIDVSAPAIARKAQPGQFVGVCPEDGDERIPLSIIEANADRGTISLIVQEVGATTGKLAALPINESIASILGPLGMPSVIEKKGVVVCIATGIGTAKILPIARALKERGNRVIAILGAKTKRSILLESQMRIACNKIMIATNDGSFGRRGLATDIFREVLGLEPIDAVYAAGSVAMLQEVCGLTKRSGIPTRVQLNPLMVDGMGMSGSCRVKIGGRIVMASIEGPEFDGHEVDFEDFLIRKEAFAERKPCPSRMLPSNPQKSGPGILTKFLSGILKK